MADAGVTPQWFVLLSNHVTAWIDERVGRSVPFTKDPFTKVEQDPSWDMRIYGPTRTWYLNRLTMGVMLAFDDDRSGMHSVAFVSQGTAEADVIAVLQEYADRWHAEALAEALA